MSIDQSHTRCPNCYEYFRIPWYTEEERMCPNCGRQIPMDARICPYYGKNFQNFNSIQQITLKYCPDCGVKNKIDAKFCEDCGSQL